MRILLDTEFTGLPSPGFEPRLISLALVSEDDALQFYAELSDGWTLSDCSDWVQTNVVSKLDRRPETTMTRAEAAEGLRFFLAGFDEAVVCFDSEHDRRFLLDLLGSLPANVRLENINSQIEQAVFEGYFGGRSELKHHALTDARALACSYRLTQEMRAREMRDRDDTA